MNAHPHYILTLSCPDIRGIVARVTGFLAEQDGFIIESAQYGDSSTGVFFLRIEFALGAKSPAIERFTEQFAQDLAATFKMQFEIHAKARKSRLLIMVSKHGHCLNDLLYRYATGQLAVEIPAIVSNHEDWKHVADWHEIPFHYMPVLPMNKPAQEKSLLELIAREKIDVVALARYMQILSPETCQALAGKAINIHHSFLPSFKGAKPYEQAYQRGVKLIGATAHYVTSDLDEGPIIEQEVARVDHTHRVDDLTAIGRDIENIVLARALKLHIEHRVILNGRKTVIFK